MTKAIYARKAVKNLNVPLRQTTNTVDFKSDTCITNHTERKNSTYSLNANATSMASQQKLVSLSPNLHETKNNELHPEKPARIVRRVSNELVRPSSAFLSQKSTRGNSTIKSDHLESIHKEDLINTRNLLNEEGNRYNHLKGNIDDNQNKIVLHDQHLSSLNAYKTDFLKQQDAKKCCESSEYVVNKSSNSPRLLVRRQHVHNHFDTNTLYCATADLGVGQKYNEQSNNMHEFKLNNDSNHDIFYNNKNKISSNNSNNNSNNYNNDINNNNDINKNNNNNSASNNNNDINNNNNNNNYLLHNKVSKSSDLKLETLSNFLRGQNENTLDNKKRGECKETANTCCTDTQSQTTTTDDFSRTSMITDMKKRNLNSRIVGGSDSDLCNFSKVRLLDDNEVFLMRRSHR